MQVMLGQTLQHHYISLNDERVKETEKAHKEPAPPMKTPLEVILLILRTPAITVLTMWHVGSLMWWIFNCCECKWVGHARKGFESLVRDERNTSQIEESLPMIPHLKCPSPSEGSEYQGDTPEAHTRRTKCKMVPRRGRRRSKASGGMVKAISDTSEPRSEGSMSTKRPASC